MIGSASAPDTTQQPLLRMAGVSVRLQGAEVLSDISWQLLPGEHWAVVGDNGAGKSTFLRLLAGELWPEPGTGTRIYEFGYGPQRDAVLARGHFRRVSPELQDQYLRFEWNLTGREVVSTGIHGIEIPRLVLTREQIQVVSQVLQQLGIEHLADRRFLELSSGEQRKLLIARALAGRPAVLLLDEMLDNLDAAARASLLALLHALHGQVSIVCSAHESGRLPGFVDHLIELERGRIAYQGPRRTRPGRTPSVEAPAPVATNKAAAASAAQIVLQDVDVYLKGKRVLAGVSWRLGPGEHWRVLGPNGAGKSTLLRVLYGSLRPALGGSVSYAGLPQVAPLAQIRRKLAHVSPALQARHLYDMTVEQCVLSGHERTIGLVRPVTDQELAAAHRWLQALGLSSLCARSIRRLSYGQVRLVLIARALVAEPEILLLDEPMAGLGPRARDRIEDALAQVIAGGTQLVAATHECGWLESSWTHQLSLQDGRVVASGPSRA